MIIILGVAEIYLSVARYIYILSQRIYTSCLLEMYISSRGDVLLLFRINKLLIFSV